jgi:hypothetical protein
MQGAKKKNQKKETPCTEIYRHLRVGVGRSLYRDLPTPTRILSD